jgi:hypothetical protein
MYICSLLWSNVHRFGGMYHLHLQGDWLALCEYGSDVEEGDMLVTLLRKIYTEL